jgi:hypothetical protein
MSSNHLAHTATTALVAAGLVDEKRAAEAERVVATVLAPSAIPRAPLRRKMSEVAGYVGAAFLFGAAVLFFAGEWSSLGRTAQTALLGGIALLFAGGCLGVVASGGGPRGLRRSTQQVRRRLASVLATAAVAATGFAVAVPLWDRLAHDSATILLAASAALVVALVGYRAAPSVLGQVAVAVAAMVVLPSGLDTVGSVTGVALGGLVLALGLAWLVLAERGRWSEQQPARVVGCLLALLGGQIPVLIESQTWVGYVGCAAVGAAAFAAYVVRPAWPYLAAGVAAVTLAIPEALFDWTSGSLGSAGVLLAAGVSLLAASLLGLRLRHEARTTEATGPGLD